MDFILGIQSNTDEYVDSSMSPKLIKLLDTAQHIHIFRTFQGSCPLSNSP